MEKEIKMAAKLYECRDTAKKLAKIQGVTFKSAISQYTTIIEAVMESKELKPLEALLFISETKTYKESGMAQMMFMAALTELLEPSE